MQYNTLYLQRENITPPNIAPYMWTDPDLVILISNGALSSTGTMMFIKSDIIVIIKDPLVFNDSKSVMQISNDQAFTSDGIVVTRPQ